jgi:hypothetical protein
MTVLFSDSLYSICRVTQRQLRTQPVQEVQPVKWRIYKSNGRHFGALGALSERSEFAQVPKVPTIRFNVNLHFM